MAYTVNSVPPSINITTTPAVIQELTTWEQIQLWFQNSENVSKYIIIPSFAILVGGCIILYIIHRLRRVYKRNKRKQRRLKRLESDKSPILEEKTPVQSFENDEKRLTYNDHQPKKSSLYPKKSEHNPYMIPRPYTQPPKKRMLSISTRCRCEGSMHQPGCSQFALPDIKKALKPAGHDNVVTSTSDVQVAVKEAMDKVANYEQELKTNPAMQELLKKYRRLRDEQVQRSIDENVQKRNWQKVPIAELLERKRKMKESGRHSTNF